MKQRYSVGYMACQFSAVLAPSVKIMSPHACAAWVFYFYPKGQHSRLVVAHIQGGYFL